MNERWVGKKKKNWISGSRAKPKRKETPKVLKEDNPDEDYGIIYYPVKCPRCRSKNVRQYSKFKLTRYFKCRHCHKRFKATEIED